MKKVLIPCLLLFNLSAPAFAETHLFANSQTRKVVTYNNQAMVTRTLHLSKLKPGALTVKIQDLPVDLILDSVSVTGHGTAQAIIHDLEIRPLEKQAVHPEIQKIQARLKSIQNQRDLLGDQQKVNKEHRDFLATVKSISDEKIRKQLAYYQIKLKDWEDLNGFLLRHHQEILASERKISQALQKLNEEQNELQEAMRTLQTKNQQRKQSGKIYLSVDQAGDLDLDLSYMVPGVSWSSAYEARLDREQKKLKLAYFGDVKQATQENWVNSELSLSTSNALWNVRIPQLYPWQLSYYQPPAPSPALAKERSPKGARSELEDAIALGGAIVEERKADYAQSEVVDKGVSVVYKIPQPVSIESSNYSRRVAILTRSFDYEQEYDVFPRLSEQAFLKIKFKNTSGLPFLAGPARTYIDDDFSGKTGLALILQNEEGTIPFGVDSNLKVSRKQTKSEESIEGVLRDTRRSKRAYQMEISNFTKEAQKVNLYDHLPISKDQRIKVKLVDIQPKPDKMEETGILKWELKLAPWEKKTVSLEFWVDAPASMPLSL
ncbi:hypothetical protein COW36_18880 [bacterium (Candidatus Blackallbacteria) CG17_big_fil_post_rev_8_21_14_2_50_48_46]|uniref:DUF4139 domain-containing protein n=1 Tax=bacterium (Candidatus Blackallbacteria) CG17_big_fil_post_rev_8_21_14_2_50_48_46 TaxID=2014261 RepID=A0A2M7FZY5_9BACT|nr:MAG: hypothetical protein COW36_18880 [bacterium (Candidatus Blackallbacteria) CG17_big_fil_post_rev_8_21_14_2_50_48_46]PIW50073.1 MAG: hypothetical protein COW20_03815 [bacterium (Candidatus Blackallbacteria) CG13_big_fil_rev_8_21_14_2_50_49_14]